MDPTGSCEWMCALWTEFPEAAPACVLVAEDDTGVRGILPCVVRASKFSVVPHRVLLPTSGVYGVRTGLLVAGDSDVLRALILAAFREAPGWDAIRVHLVGGGRSQRAFNEALDDLPLYPIQLRAWTSPWGQLPTTASKVGEEIGSTRLRANIRYGERQLAKLGDLRMTFVESAEQAASFVEIMCEVDAKSWKQSAGTAMTSDERQKRMYTSAMTAMASGRNWLGAVLWLNDRPIAFIWGLVDRNVFIDDKESYDEEYKKHGPGNVLKMRFLTELVERGISVLDYGGTAEAHKARWIEDAYSRHEVLACRRTPSGLAMRVMHRLRQNIKSQPVTDETTA